MTENVKELCKCQDGHILLQTIIIMPILIAMLFLPFSFSVVQHKRSVINDVLDKSLQRAAIEGGVTAGVKQIILNDLQAMGLDPNEVIIEPSHYTKRLRGEFIEITISVPGNASALKGVAAVGASPPPTNWRITAAGSIMSEKLP